MDIFIIILCVCHLTSKTNIKFSVSSVCVLKFLGFGPLSLFASDDIFITYKGVKSLLIKILRKNRSSAQKYYMFVQAHMRDYEGTTN